MVLSRVLHSLSGIVPVPEMADGQAGHGQSLLAGLLVWSVLADIGLLLGLIVLFVIVVLI